MLTYSSACVYLFTLIYFSSQSNTVRTLTLKNHVCIAHATTEALWCSCFTELNKNRRKLFEPPIRSSFLEGGASGRLSRQFHADMASISGRWQAPPGHPRTVHTGDLPPVSFCVSATQVSVVVYPLSASAGLRLFQMSSLPYKYKYIYINKKSHRLT